MKRFAVTFDMYVYAEDKEKAEEIAKKLSQIFDNCGELCSTDLDVNDLLREQNDNKCQVLEVVEAPFGKGV